MSPKNMMRSASSGIGAALLSALLFGVSTPVAKILSGDTPPVLLAGLLYLGSGVGLGLWVLARRGRSTEKKLSRRDLPWMLSAVTFGGIVGPVLLMIGLVNTTGTTASLLLNLEAVFTASLAWFAFGDHVDRRIAVGFGLIVLGGFALAWQPGTGFAPSLGWLAIAGACVCWALDNNLTQKIAASDPLQIAAVKGLAAGLFNVTAAVVLGNAFPPPLVVSGALGVGCVGYGLSLALFVVALRHVGTARTSAYFSIAPFAGAILSLVLLRESPSPLTVLAGLLMAGGVWLHLTERHDHLHEHFPITHEHLHVHDEHHRHHGAAVIAPDEPHTHIHDHASLVHAHPHFPDIHHRHDHEKT